MFRSLGDWRFFPFRGHAITGCAKNIFRDFEDLRF